MKWIIRKFRKYASGNLKIHKILERYLRGELSPEAEKDFADRIQDSISLKKELKEWEELDALLRAGGTPEKNEEYWEDYRKSLARRLDTGKETRVGKLSSPLWRIKPSYAAAAAMLVIAVLVAYRVWTPEVPVNQLADAGQGNWLELCINEFDTVSQEEVIFEPPPQHPVKER